MNLEDLKKQIRKELKIDRTKLAEEMSLNPLFVQQYLTLFLGEQRKLAKLQKEYDLLLPQKMIFYKRDHKFIPDNIAEMNAFLNADAELGKIRDDIKLQTSIVNYIEETVKNFRDRGWAIKNIIDITMFMEGR